MKTITLDDNLSVKDLLDQGCEEDVVIILGGHAIALLSPFDDDDAEWYAREHDVAFLESLKRARQQVTDRDTVSMEELKRELGIDL